MIVFIPLVGLGIAFALSIAKLGSVGTCCRLIMFGVGVSVGKHCPCHSMLLLGLYCEVCDRCALTSYNSTGRILIENFVHMCVPFPRGYGTASKLVNSNENLTECQISLKSTNCPWILVPSKIPVSCAVGASSVLYTKTRQDTMKNFQCLLMMSTN